MHEEAHKPEDGRHGPLDDWRAEGVQRMAKPLSRAVTASFKRNDNSKSVPTVHDK